MPIIGGSISGVSGASPVGSGLGYSVGAFIPTTLTIGGSVIARPANGVILDSFQPYLRDDIPALRFHQIGRGFLKPNDSWMYEPVQIGIDLNDGRGSVTYFSGDILDCHATPEANGFQLNYTALSIRYRADDIPITDDNTGQDSIYFNLSNPNDPNYRIDRTGRSYGQAILSVLEGNAISQGLMSKGLGNYTTTGSGATAHCVMTGHSVANIIVDTPGSGYGTAPTVVLVGGGGTGATATAAISGGGVITITVGVSGSGYNSPPVVVLSRLPLATLNDLSTVPMQIVPPHEMVFSGERVFGAIDGILKDRLHNHWLECEADGTIRFFDQRLFGTTVVVVSAPGAGGIQARVAPIIHQGQIVGCSILNPGSNYTSATATITDPSGSGGGITLTVTSGSLSGASVSSAGSGYGGPLGALWMNRDPFMRPKVMRDHKGCYQRVQIRGTSYNEPIRLALSDGSLIEQFAHDGLDNAQAKLKWTSNDFLDPYEDGSRALVISTINATTNVVTSIALSNAGYGYAIGSSPAVTIHPAPGSGASFDVTVTSGAVSNVTILTGGTGFDVVPTGTFIGGGGTGATITFTVSGSAITGVSWTGGSGYQYAPSIAIIGGGAGSGAAGHTTGINSDGSIAGLALSSGGTGYKADPIVTIAAHGVGAHLDGTCTCSSSTSVVITSSDPTSVFPSDYYDQTDSGIHGVIAFSYLALTGVLVQETRRIIANTAMTAGGTSTVTLDLPLSNLNYVMFEIMGDATPSSLVYRAYTSADPTIRGLFADMFSFPVSITLTSGGAGFQTQYRTATILYSPNGLAPFQEEPASFRLNRDTGLILFDRPVVFAYGTKTNLAKGGTSVDGVPSDLHVWLPRRAATLTATAPPDSGGSPTYSGTSYSDTSGRMARTKIIAMNDWTDPAVETQVQLLANDVLDSIQDTVFETDIAWEFMLGCCLYPGMGISLSCDEATTGMESLDLPVVGSTITWPEGAGPVITFSNLHVSNRRAYLGGSNWIPPQRTSQPVQFGDGQGLSPQLSLVPSLATDIPQDAGDVE